MAPKEPETPPKIFGRRLGALLRRWGAGWGPLVGSKLEGVEFPAFEPARERERERARRGAPPSPILKLLNRRPYVALLVNSGRQQPPPGSVWAAGLHGRARRPMERLVRCSRRLEWLKWTTRRPLLQHRLC